MGEIYILVYRDMITKILTATTDFNVVIDYLENKMLYYDIRDCYISVYGDNGVHLRSMDAEAIIKERWKCNTLALPQIDFNDLVEKEVDGCYWTKGGILFGIEADGMYDEGELTAEIYSKEDEIEKVVFWLSNLDYRKSLRNPSHLRKLIYDGEYRINEGDSNSLYKCQTIKFIDVEGGNINV